MPGAAQKYEFRIIGEGMMPPERRNMKNEAEIGWMRRASAAKYLGISQRTLTDWMQRRIIPFSKVSKKVVLFSRESLDAALGRLQTKAVRG